MNVALAVFVVAGFALVIERLDLADRAREVFNRSTDCFRVLRDPSLDDEAKQDRLQQHAVRLFVLLGVLTGGSVTAFLLPMVGVWLLDGAGVGSVREVLELLQQPVFLGGTAVVGLGVYAVLRRLGYA